MGFDLKATENLINSFSQKMLTQMQANEQKGGWESRTMVRFLDDMLEKQLMIGRAVEAHNWELVGLRCVDLANFCMMLSDRVGAEFKFIEAKGDDIQA